MLDAVDYPTAVNPRLALNAAAVLARQGHLVHYLLLWDGAAPLGAPPAGCGRFVLPFADERRMNEALEHGNAAGAPVPVRLARLAARPDAALAAVRMLALHRPRRQAACRRRIAGLDAVYHYDAVVAVAAPYHAVLALAGTAVGGKRAAWLMDPYSQNHAHSAPPPRLLAEETALYRAMDRVFVTRLMAPDYAPGGPFAEFAQKAHLLEFPALVPAAAQDSTPAPAAAPAQGGSIRCVFVGNLYPELRTPEGALRLFTALNDPAVSLEFYGGGWEHFAPGSPVSRAAEQAERVLGSRFAAHGPVPPETARRLMAGADILISLGNTAANQLPSKVFEYCGAGLPVLHLARRPDDPALPCFAKYPLACVIGPEELDALVSPGVLPPCGGSSRGGGPRKSVGGGAPTEQSEVGEGVSPFPLWRGRSPREDVVSPGVLPQQSCGSSLDTLARLQRFLHDAAGRRLPFAEARRLFWENTPEAVAERLLALLG